MPIMDSGKVTAELRERITLERKLRTGLTVEEMEFKRIFKYNMIVGKSVPAVRTRRKLQNSASMPKDDYLYTHLENQPLNVYAMRSSLIYALDIGNTERAQHLLNEIAALKGFDAGINLQFLLSQQSRLMNITNQPPNEIIPLILKAIGITFDKFSEKKLTNALLYEEPRLLHTFALARARNDQVSQATRLFKYGIKDLLAHSPDDTEYNNILINMVYDYARFLAQAKKYTEAEKACDMGIHISVMRKLGRFIPEFCYTKALALKGQNKHDKCKPLLQQSYFNHILLQNEIEAKKVLVSAKKDFGITFKVYAVKNTFFIPQLKTEYKLGQMQNYKTLNEMVADLRFKAGLTVRQLAEGLCPHSTLNKFENKELIEAQLYYLEPVLQRLGRGVDPYTNVFLSTRAYNARKTREEITQLLTVKHYSKAEKKLNALEKEKDYQMYANRQFVLLAKATIYMSKNGNDETYLNKILEALAVTWKNFDENVIHKRAMHYYEAVLVNQLGNYYAKVKDYSRANKIYKQLFEQLDAQCVDDTQKAMLFDTVAYNYSGGLNDVEQWEKAIEIAECGINFACRHGSFLKLPGLVLNKAFAVSNMGGATKEKSVPFFALAFYGFSILADYGMTGNMEITRNLVKEHFNIVFDY